MSSWWRMWLVLSYDHWHAQHTVQSSNVGSTLVCTLTHMLCEMWGYLTLTWVAQRCCRPGPVWCCWCCGAVAHCCCGMVTWSQWDQSWSVHTRQHEHTTSLTLHSWSRLLSNILTTIISKKFYRCAHTFDMLPSATNTRPNFSLPGLTVCAHCLLTLLNILELNNWWIVNFVETKYTWIMPKLPKNYFSIKPNSRVKRIMTIYHAREQKLKF